MLPAFAASLKLRLVSDFPNVVQQVLFLQWILFCRPKHQILLRRYPCLSWPSPYQCRVLHHNHRWFYWCPKTASSLLVLLQSFSKGSSESCHALRYPAPLCTAGGLARASHPGEPHTRASRQLDLRHVAKACRMVATVIRWSQLSPKLYSGDR